jgi:hypothetical protein
MKLNLLACDKFVENSNLQEVTSSAMFSQKSSAPAENGLVSFEIFGQPNSTERRTVYGYIDLHGVFIHPHVYLELARLYRGFPDLVNGNTHYCIVNRKLRKLKKDEEAPKNAPSGTGIPFLHKYWSEINFKPTPDDAPATATRMKFISLLSKDEVFLSKVPVIPAFYRDVSLESTKKNDINVFYSRLISNAQVIKSGSTLFDLYGFSSAHRKIQDTLIEMYEYFITILGGTKGFIHQNIMGKTTDYSARSVITMQRFDGSTPTNSEVSFTHCALPLSMCIKMFAPFVRYGVKRIFESLIGGNKFIYSQNKDGRIERLEISPNVYDMISQDSLQQLIDLYDESKEHRFDLLTIPTVGGKKVPCLYLYNDPTTIEADKDKIVFGTDPSVEELILDNKVSTINMTELFYMAAYDTVKDKCIYITRYPVEDMKNIFSTFFNIVPCMDTEKRIINGVEYPRFPKRAKKNTILKHFFIDSLRFSPAFLKSLGADFDGDVVSCQGIFTQEANDEAAKTIHSKLNILDIASSSVREFPTVCAQSMYFLTYRKKQRA